MGPFPALRPAPRAAVLALALGLALLAAPAARAETPFRIGTSATGLLVWIAQAMGAFEDAGVEVAVERLSSGVEGLDRTESGALDLAASSEFAFTTRIAQGADLCIYGTLSASRTVELLARADRVGPSPADLAGKRIGITQGSVARFFLWQYLALEQVPDEAPSSAASRGKMRLRDAALADQALDETICIICMEEPRSMAAIKCGHRHVCSTCVTDNALDYCPTCMTPTPFFIQIFL